MKPWERYQSQEAQGKPWEQYQEPVIEPSISPPTEPIGAVDVAQAGMAGVNELLPALAGLPVDTMQNIVNLGISAYGLARGKLGKYLGEKGYVPPELLASQPGGSQWIKEKITEGLGSSPFEVTQPESRALQNIKMGSSILASGAMVPATSATQMAGNVARMAPSAAGAVAGRELFPDQPLAPIAGAMAAPLGVQAAKNIPKTASNALMKASQLGYKVPPAMAKGTKTQQFLEGTAGPVPTKQKASIHNQQVTNRLIKKDIDYPEDVPLSHEGLEGIRANASKAYERVRNFGSFKMDKQFADDLAAIAGKQSSLAKEFPGLVKKDVAKLVDNFRIKSASSDAVVDVIKQLRADSKVGYTSSDPSVKAMAQAQSKIAQALEGVIERNVKTVNPDLLPAMQQARQTIAKTYTIGKALKGENVDAVALARELDKGKPLSGAMKDVAEFAQNFKGAAQTNVPQQTNFRPMDLAAGAGAALGTGQPGWLVAMGLRPALRTALLSKPYQALLAKVTPADIERIMAMPQPSREVAIIQLLEQARGQENNALAR